MPPLSDDEWKRLQGTFREIAPYQRSLHRELVASGALESMREMQVQLASSGALESIRQMQEQLASSGAQHAIRQMQERLASSGAQHAIRQMQEQLASSGALASIRQMQEQLASSGAQQAIESMRRSFQGLDQEQRQRVITLVQNTHAESVIDAEAAFEAIVEPDIADGEHQLPADGPGAILFVFARLSPARRRDLYLRCLALALATYLYVNALAADENTAAYFLNALLQNFWLYSSVVSALDETEDELRSDDHDDHDLNG